MGTGFEFNTIMVFNHPGNPGWGLCIKKGFRIYPIKQPIPLIQDGKCLHLVEIWKLEHLYEDGQPVTGIKYNVIQSFLPGDPVAAHYEKTYQEHQDFKGGDNSC